MGRPFVAYTPRKDYMTIRAAATELGVSIGGLERLVLSHRITAVETRGSSGGRELMIPKTEVSRLKAITSP